MKQHWGGVGDAETMKRTKITDFAVIYADKSDDIEWLFEYGYALNNCITFSHYFIIKIIGVFAWKYTIQEMRSV